MSGRASQPTTSNEESRESLYSILNLPVSASQDDIRHRYKELAVIFHPDRQTTKDENTKRVAEKRFREIQRAYEGEGGLVARKALGQRYSSPEEVGPNIDLEACLESGNPLFLLASLRAVSI
ncbi:hypothetical protein JB92DRAFT_1452854 [Gautieria morchelliformis]|nr:hypothetical protein JB92DRAFT_1452854 [Gautieria morchelliformis]